MLKKCSWTIFLGLVNSRYLPWVACRKTTTRLQIHSSPEPIRLSTVWNKGSQPFLLNDTSEDQAIRPKARPWAAAISSTTLSFRRSFFQFLILPLSWRNTGVMWCNASTSPWSPTSIGLPSQSRFVFVNSPIIPCKAPQHTPLQTPPAFPSFLSIWWRGSESLRRVGCEKRQWGSQWLANLKSGAPVAV